MEPRLYSYKMTDDSGFAPNPLSRILTLATCKASMGRSKGQSNRLTPSSTAAR